MRPSKELWILVFLLVILGGLAILTVRHSTTQQGGIELFPRRTSLSPRPTGVKALYLTLERLGYRVRRHRAPLFLLPQEAQVGVLFVLSPEPLIPLASHEWRHLAKWVQAGRLACLAFDDPGTVGLQDWYRSVPNRGPPNRSEGLGMEAEQSPPPTRATATWPSAWTRGAPRLAVKGKYRFDLISRALPNPARRREERGKEGARREPPGHTPSGEDQGDQEEPLIGKKLPEEVVPVWDAAATLYQDSQGPVVAYSAWGKGGFLLVSSPWLFSNDGLDEDDNLALVLNVLQVFAPARSGKVILFDEFHHGYGKRRLLWQVTPPAVRLGLIQVALALLALLFGLSRRFAAPLPLLGEEQRSRAEYLASMATLFQRARATRLVLQCLEGNFRRDVAGFLAQGPDVSEEQLVRAAARRNPDLGPPLQRLFDRLSQVKQMNPPSEEALQQLAAEMYTLRQEVRDKL